MDDWGEELSARYERVRILGHGAFGEVSLAVERATGRRVAVKRVFARGGGASGGARTGAREARALRAVVHDNVVRLLEAHRQDTCIHLVQELCPTDLAHILAAARAPLPAAVAKGLAAQMLAGLAACHAAGIMHRDVKPSNLLLSFDGQLKLADFGLARRMKGAASAATPDQPSGETRAPVPSSSGRSGGRASSSGRAGVRGGGGSSSGDRGLGERTGGMGRLYASVSRGRSSSSTTTTTSATATRLPSSSGRSVPTRPLNPGGRSGPASRGRATARSVRGGGGRSTHPAAQGGGSGGGSSGSEIDGAGDGRYSPAAPTRWYRAPELLYGARRYDGAAVDVWAAGATVAEILGLGPLIPGTSDIGQLAQLQAALGPITLSDWPAAAELPDWGKVRFEGAGAAGDAPGGASGTSGGGIGSPGPGVIGGGVKQRLAALLPDAPEDALDLLCWMLRYPPHARPSAAEALAHPYFSRNPPAAAAPAEIAAFAAEALVARARLDSRLSTLHAEVAAATAL